MDANNYNVIGHTCPQTGRTCRALSEWDELQPAWICYPWSHDHTNGIWRSVREVHGRMVIFNDGTYRKLMEGEPKVIYQ